MAKSTSLRWRVAQWLEIRWWQRYLAKKDIPDYRQQKIDYWQRVLRTMDMKVPGQARVLDAGCGPAGIFLVFPQNPVLAIDPLLSQYAEKIAHFSPSDHLKVIFQTLALEQLQIEQTYDYVFCMNAINHVSDWELSLQRLSAAAKPGAQLLLGIDVHRWAALKPLFRSIPGDVLHPHQHDREDYLAALAKLGWQVDHTHTWSQGLIFDYWLVRASKK